MNFKVNIKVCRVCMKSEDGHSLYKDLELQSKFVFTTRLSLQPGDSMPAIICPKCIMRLKIAHEFVQLAHASDKNLRSFLEKISSDFQEVTKTTSTTSSPMPADDEMMSLIDEANDYTSILADVKETSNLVQKKDLNTQQSSTAKKRKSSPVISKLKEEIVPLKESFKKEIIEFDGTEEVVYYEDAHFLEESENEEADKQNLFESKVGDSQSNVEAGEENTQKEDDQHQIQGYLQEYNVMLSDQDNCTDSITTQYIYEQSIDEDELEATTTEEDMQLYEDSVELLQEQDDTTTIDDDDRTEMLMEVSHTSSSQNIEETSQNNDMNPSIICQGESSAKAKSTQKQPRTTSKPRKLGTSSASINARFFCVKCNRDFSTKTNLTRHMSTHEGLKPYQCTECGKRFSQNGSLKQHMYTHTGEKPFVCEVCNRGFTQCKSLVFHMRRHTGEKPFPCDHCGMFFRQKDGLKTHILKHHMIRETDGETETHTCIICKKLLATKHALQEHMKKHINNYRPLNLNAHSIGGENSIIELLSEDDLLNDKAFISEDLALNLEDVSSSTQIVDTTTANTAKASRVKKFQCRKCYKCFAIKKNLLRHLTTHDVRPSELFQCKTCQVAFDTNYALRVHRVREHKEMGINLNECEYCNITFSNAAELSDHNSTVHDVTDQKCPECPDLHFKTQKQLLEHMMEHEILLHEEEDE